MTVYEDHYTNIWQPVGTPLTTVQEEGEDSFWDEMELTGFDGSTFEPMNSVSQRMVVILVFVVMGAFLFGVLALPRIQGRVDTSNGRSAANTGFAASGSSGGISPLFTREVQHWSPQIVAWANQYGLDPNMVATVMQIESCGDPGALSIAGAQGLFQVMPFHFQQGEDAFNPDTNAMRGMMFLADLVKQFGDPALAFAGYNGGPGNAVKSWDAWPAEMQRYYKWASGIYTDASAGHSESETLNEWLAAGGAGGCARAATNLGIN